MAIPSTTMFEPQIDAGPGPRPQMKDRLTRYRNFCYNDKTVVRYCYLYNGNPYTGKAASLYWDPPPLQLKSYASSDQSYAKNFAIGSKYLSIILSLATVYLLYPNKFGTCPSRTTCVWHNDVMIWRCFVHYLPFVRGINGDQWFPSQRVSNTELCSFSLMSVWPTVE